MNDMRRRRNIRPAKNPAGQRRSENDIYSSSRGKRGSKKHNGRRIVANVVASLIMAVSLITLTGILALGLRPFDDANTAEENRDEKEWGSVAGSVDENVSYILVVGVDKSENLTDVVMLVCYDIKNKSANIMQIPRDTYVGKEIATGKTGKFNAVYGSPRKNETNINALKRVLNNMFGLPVDHHVIISIDALRDIVDIVGGVTINIDKQMTLEDFRTGKRTVKIGPGEVKLDGHKAESWMRERKSYDLGDPGRLKAQRSFYAGFAEKMMKMNMSQMTSVARKCFDKIKTDMNIGQLLGYAEAARGLELSNIGIYQVPGVGDYFSISGLGRRSFFSADMNGYIDLAYQYFNPYGDIKYDNINIIQLHKGNLILGPGGQTLEELK